MPDKRLLKTIMLCIVDGNQQPLGQPVPPSCIVSFVGCQFGTVPTRLLSSPARHIPPANRLTSLTSCKTTDQPEHHDHRTNCYLSVPQMALAFSAKAFSVSAPSVWNSLSYQCRSAELFSSFRCILKTELFDIAYSERKQSA